MKLPKYCIKDEHMPFSIDNFLRKIEILYYVNEKSFTPNLNMRPYFKDF